MLLFNPERPLETTILIYLIVLAILFMIKPKFLFDPKGNLKQFATGSGNRRTILPLWLIISLIGIVIYYIVIVFNYRNQIGGLCKDVNKGINNGKLTVKELQELLNLHAKCDA